MSKCKKRTNTEFEGIKSTIDDIQWLSKKAPPTKATFYNNKREALIVDCFHIQDDHSFISDSQYGEHWKFYSKHIKELINNFGKTLGGIVINIINRGGSNWNWDFDVFVRTPEGTEHVHKLEFKFNANWSTMPQFMQVTEFSILEDAPMYEKYFYDNGVPELIKLHNELKEKEPSYDLIETSDSSFRLPEFFTVPQLMPTINFDDFKAAIKKTKTPNIRSIVTVKKKDGIEPHYSQTTKLEVRQFFYKIRCLYEKGQIIRRVKKDDEQDEENNKYVFKYEEKYKPYLARQEKIAKDTITAYLKIYFADKFTDINLKKIETEIKKRQGIDDCTIDPKYYMFYKENKGALNTYFIQPNPESQLEPRKQWSTKGKSKLKSDRENTSTLIIELESGNVIEFMLRWKNGMCLSNIAWQINCKLTDQVEVFMEKNKIEDPTLMLLISNDTRKRTKCPKGTRKNKKTGNCEEKKQ